MRFVPNTWMDNLADEVLKDPFFRKNNVPAVMKTDIREQEDGYLLDIELPGFKKGRNQNGTGRRLSDDCGRPHSFQ